MSDITTLMMGAAGQVGGDYQIERSLRFNYDDSTYLNRTPANAGNQKTWTWSGWVKPSAVGVQNFIFSAGDAYNVGDCLALQFDTASQFRIRKYAGGVGTNVKRTTQVFRDTSAWYHIVVAIDTTNATEEDRQRIYVNGERVTDFIDSNNYAPDALTSVNTTKTHIIGNLVGFATGYYRGYMADIHFIDGQALTPSSFGEVDSVTGVWKPIRYAGTYGTNGFHLDFSDNSSTTALGYDAAGSNDWTPNNFSVTAGAGNDSLVDTPTQYGTDTGAGGQVRGNYATWNPLNAKLGTGSLTNGNLTFTGASGESAYNFTGGTFGIDTSTSTGWYFEVTQTTYGAFAGVSLLDTSFNASALNTAHLIGGDSNSAAGITYRNSGSLHNYGSTTTGLTTWSTSGDVISVAIKDNKIWFAKNGTWISGDPGAGTSPSITLSSTKTVTPAATGLNSNVFNLNAGQRPFAYTAPSGFKALCTTNLPDPTVVQGDDYFNTVLYTGNSTTNAITGVGFQPDLTWFKSRSNSTFAPLNDSVRGINKILLSNATNAEITGITYLNSIDSDGFTLANDSPAFNYTGYTYVAWNWKANGAGVSNTDGTITSTVSANTTAGISIVTYTGNGNANATVGHGLGVIPAMIIVKQRNTTGPWYVKHASLSSNNNLLLNGTDAAYNVATGSSDGGLGNLSSATTFGFLAGTSNVSAVNENTGTFVALVFSEVKNFSAFGSYTGNGSTDGPFVYTGFRPAFIMIKNTTTAGRNWLMFDVKRNTYNVVDDALKANASDAEASANWLVDFLSNGFKLRNDATSGGPNTNNSGDNYIYACFAEVPFRNSLAR